MDIKPAPAAILRFVSAAAMIRSDGAILLQKRPEGKALAGLWEFPGGKWEDGETPENALARELQEEIGIKCDPNKLIPLTFASQPVAGKHLLLLLYVLEEWHGEPASLEGADIGWFYAEKMHALAMPPADIPFLTPLAEYVARR